MPDTKTPPAGLKGAALAAWNKANLPKPAGLTVADVQNPPTQEVSQETANTPEAPNDPNPEQPQAKESKAAEAPPPAKPAKPAAASPDKALDEMEARLRKERPHLFGGQGVHANVDVPLDIDGKKLRWRPHRTTQHLFRIADAPGGGYYAEPQSFKGDVRKIAHTDELEFFESWPNKGK